MATQPLPDTITRFFAAQNAHDAPQVAACFADDGLVRDEGHAYTGRAAIGAWQREASEKYATQAAPQSWQGAAQGAEQGAEQGAGQGWRVAATVSGNFPGSPLTIQFDFTLRGHLIGALEITA